MAKKLSMFSVVLALLAVLGLVYFFRPQTFNFLKQGFYDEPENYDDGEGFEEGDFEDKEEGFEDGDFEDKEEGFEDGDFEDKEEGFEDGDFDDEQKVEGFGSKGKTDARVSAVAAPPTCAPGCSKTCTPCVAGCV